MDILDYEKSRKPIILDTSFLIGYGIFGYLSIQVIKDLLCDTLEYQFISNDLEYSTTFWFIRFIGLFILLSGITVLKNLAKSSAKTSKLNFVYTVITFFVLNIIQFFYFTYKYEVLDLAGISRLDDYHKFIQPNYLNYLGGIISVEYISIAVILLLGNTALKENIHG